ncbi:MAG: hypothetical protein OXU20_22155 [Myxococcales bacterium]|nr:hypothetical protein [Myxococcales bacterium]MDD9968101.1 hypothetical protein [Myxococcales bacterium]
MSDRRPDPDAELLSEQGEPTEEELAEAQALAEALERGDAVDVSVDAPVDVNALRSAALLRHSAARDVLEGERLQRGLDALESFAEAAHPVKVRRLRWGTALAGGLAIAAAAVLAVLGGPFDERSTTAPAGVEAPAVQRVPSAAPGVGRAPAPAAAPSLAPWPPSPTAALLAAQARLAGSPAAIAEVDAAMADYRRAMWTRLRSHYPRPFGSLRIRRGGAPWRE